MSSWTSTCLPALPLATLALCAGSVGVAVPAGGAPPKGFSKTVTFVDETPDPSAYVLGPEHCLGRLPREEPVSVQVPGSGIVRIAIRGFQGEWSLLVWNAAGDVIATADADVPATESLELRVKKAQRIQILPCNLLGTFEATLTYSYTFKKL